MHYLSTRTTEPAGVDFATAVNSGLAPDGGLYVPERLPAFDSAAIAADAPLPELAGRVLRPFLAGSRLEDRLDDICHEALAIELPIKELETAPAWMMELFHGPTAAFKDFAARFLAACLAALREPGDPDRTVLVATSGDTGGAVAAAFCDRPGFRVVILYPDGRVSARQAHQLGAFGGNIQALRVQGSFDDCQRLAKRALSDPELRATHGITSANSISIGRLLPQISYYALAALRLSEPGRPVNVIVPTGNLGNALASVLAREMGLPIGEIFLATNANRTLPDYFEQGIYRGRPGLETLANAMDVGDPSNFERLEWFYRDRDLRDAELHADSVDDAAISACIRREFEDRGRMICPHTACAVEVLRRRRAAGDRRPFVIAATAHPAKFDTVVEPLFGVEVPLPPALAELLARPSRAEPLEADFGALKSRLLAGA